MQDVTSNIRRFEHPGRGGRARPLPKGRQVDPRARAEVEALLDGRKLRRDLLIEHLHLIQDAYRQISAAHLGALADLMGLAYAEVYEVATFYAHFDVVREGDAPVPALTVRVCDGISCELAGAERLHAALTASVGAGVRVVRAPCVGRCDTAPIAEVGHNFIDYASEASVLAAVASGDTHAAIPPYTDYETYVAAGGYATLRRLREGALTSEQVLDELDAANLR